jgi:ribosomal protein L37AE/L43A
MVMRKCPTCNSEWYSSAAEQDWICENCKAIIPKESNEICLIQEKNQ